MCFSLFGNYARPSNDYRQLIWCLFLTILRTGSEGIKLFPCTARLRMKLTMLIHAIMPKYIGILTFISMINTISERSKASKVSKVAKIRNRYNQVPHLTQDTNGKVTNSQKTPQTRAKRSALSQQVTTKHI